MNKISVVHTNGYGAGLSTWNKGWEELALDEQLAQLVLDEAYQKGDSTQVDKYLMYAYETHCDNDLTVSLIEKGRPFFIKEYDGAERIVFLDELTIYNR